MDSKSEQCKCVHCDYKSNRPYNLTRHTVTKHGHKNDNICHKNDNLGHKNDNLGHKNDNLAACDTLSCDKCTKMFKKKWFLDRHIISCSTKIDARTCEYCSKQFSHRVAKYRHSKICKVRIEDELQVLVPTPTENAVTVVNNNVNIQNISGNIQNVQNQTNNTVINLVVYNSNPNEAMQFNHNHIDPKKLKKFLIAGDNVQPERLTSVVREWTQQLLSNNDNKCVKKTNIRSAHSSVHVGNNNWETRLDKEVYPHLMNNIANDFSDFFNDNYRNNMYKALEAFIEYMASDGYCSTDSDKVIENSFKTLVKELKLRTFDLTKRE